MHMPHIVLEGLHGVVNQRGELEQELTQVELLKLLKAKVDFVCQKRIVVLM